MEIRQLLYFVTVVRRSSFSEAAKELHLSQPSLSKAIKNLEAEVGFRLLERTTKQVKLTESGRVIYKRALQMLNEVEILQEEIKEVKWNGSGKVRIGMIESVKNWIPAILHWYQQAFPSMQVKLIEVLGREDVERALRQYEVHMCLTNQYIDAEDIWITPLYEEELAIIMHPGHRLADKEVLTLADLEHETFIITSVGLQTREDIFEAFAKEDVQMDIQYEVERFETIIELVRANIGISIIPKNYFDNMSDRSLLIRTVEAEALTRTVYLAYLKNRYMPPSIEALIGRMQMPLKKSGQEGRKNE